MMFPADIWRTRIVTRPTHSITIGGIISAMKEKKQSVFYPEPDVQQFNIELGKCGDRSTVINDFFRCVMHDGGTVYIPGKGMFKISKDGK